MIRPSVLIFLAVVLHFGASIEECEENSFGRTLQDPEDCHGYYLCHNGTKMQQYCAPGMKYEKQIGVCIVGKCPPCNCADIPTPSTIAPSTSSESSTESSSNTSEQTESSIDTSTLNSTTTEQPTESTADSSPKEPSTESSTVNSISTSESTESPDLPTTEESSSQSITTPEEPTTTISNTRPPVSCENIPDGSFFSDLVHCRDYYVCRNRQPVLLHCQLGTWFDDINFVCNFRHLVNCPANID